MSLAMMLDEVQPREPLSLVAVLEELYPQATWEECDELLWLTLYPAGNFDAISARLRELRARYGESIADAIKGEYDEFDRVCREQLTDRSGAASVLPGGADR